MIRKARNLPLEQLVCLDSQRRIEILSENVVRVVFTGGMEEEPSAAVTGAAETVPGLNVRLENGRLRIQTGRLQILADETFHIDFFTADGRPLSEEYRKMRIPPYREPSSAEEFASWEGHEQPVSRENANWRFQCVRKLYDNDCIYGLGDKTGFLNKRGYAYEMWNTDNADPHEDNFRALYKSMPFFTVLGDAGAYGIFFDNHRRTFFDMGKENDGYYAFGSDEGVLDYYFIYGPTLPEILERYTALTGRMPLPPLWALGYHQSRWGYETEDEIRSIAETMRSCRVPCDCIHFDIDYMDHFKVFTWNQERYRDGKKLLADLKQDGFKAVAIIDPGVKAQPGYRVFDEGETNGYFAATPSGETYVNAVWPGDAAFPDFGNPDVRAWWGDQHRFLINMGIDGVWDDMNEPASFHGPLPDEIVFSDEERRVTHAEIHNIYGHNMTRSTYEGWKRLSGKRPFVLTRACYCGSQRYTAAWTGDNHSIWSHLRLGVVQLCNLGLSGMAFCGTDVGGFGSDTTPELLTRWVQVGCFSPFFRNHSAKGTKNQEPWRFGEPTLTINRKYVELRYRWIPYLYDQFRLASLKGWPVMRPLAFHYPSDPEARQINDAFLLGENVLVSPVLEQGARKKLVYLPEGVWYDYWTGAREEGSRWLVREAPLDVCPVYIRSGTILPTWPVRQWIDPALETELVLEVFGPNASCVHYQDGGERFDYENGAFNLYRFRTDERGTVSTERENCGCEPYRTVTTGRIVL